MNWFTSFPSIARAVCLVAKVSSLSGFIIKDLSQHRMAHSCSPIEHKMSALAAYAPQLSLFFSNSLPTARSV